MAESVDRSGVLSLNNIRQSLIRQEDSIIFSLIERSQFAHNAPVRSPSRCTDAVPATWLVWPFAHLPHFQEPTPL